MVAAAAVVGVGSVFFAPFAIAALGFGAGGVIGGSVAAGVQATIGNVAAGSGFAVMQSAGAAGVAASTSAAVGTTAGAAAGAAAADEGGYGYKSSASGMMFLNTMVPYLSAVAGDWIYAKIFY